MQHPLRASSQLDPNSVPPPQSDREQEPIFGSVAGTVVVIGSVLAVFAMMAILYLQMLAIEGATQVRALDQIMQTINGSEANLSEPGILETLGRIALETDAQYLRTARAQSLAGSRLTIQIIAELISLSLVVLGGALIFARIKSGPGGDRLRATAEGRGSFDWVITFPGLILCALGAATVAWALHISVDQNFRNQTLDGSIYLQNAAVVHSSQVAADPSLKMLCESTDYKNQKCEGLK